MFAASSPAPEVLKACRPSVNGSTLIRTWLWSEGICKSISLAPRPAAREAKLLFSNWVISETTPTEFNHQSARIHHSAGARSLKSLMSEWMWSHTAVHTPFVQAGPAMSTATPLRLSQVASTSALASRWLVRDGAARLPSWIQVEEGAARRGVSRRPLAASWLKSGALPKVEAFPSRFAVPLAAVAVLAGAVYLSEEVGAERKKIARLLVRRSSVEAPARLALRHV